MLPTLKLERRPRKLHEGTGQSQQFIKKRKGKTTNRNENKFQKKANLVVGWLRWERQCEEDHNSTLLRRFALPIPVSIVQNVFVVPTPMPMPVLRVVYWYQYRYANASANANNPNLAIPTPMHSQIPNLLLRRICLSGPVVMSCIVFPVDIPYQFAARTTSFFFIIGINVWSFS